MFDCFALYLLQIPNHLSMKINAMFTTVFVVGIMCLRACACVCVCRGGGLGGVYVCVCACLRACLSL